MIVPMQEPPSAMNPLPVARRRVRVIHYSPWADRLEDAAGICAVCRSWTWRRE